MVPEFNRDGRLPGGIHWTTWPEITSRFGFSERRRKLLGGLRQALKALLAAGCRKVYIDGSFVTVKHDPTLKAKGPKTIEIDSLDTLPRALIQARIAAGLTQEDLAARLTVKPQQIQRYEAGDYQTASFARLRDIAHLLGLDVRDRVEVGQD